MKLSLTQITKNELKNLERLYPLVKDYIDEWVVVIPPGDSAKDFLEGKATVIERDFTQAIEPEIAKRMKEWGIEVDEDYRIFNFAAARNASLEAATGDYVLWLDADDTPLGIDNVKKYVASKPHTDVFYAIYDYFRDEEGNSVSDHVRERIVRNNGKFKWLGGELGLIHETLLPVDKLYEPLTDQVPDEIFRVKHDTDHIQESSMRNHIALLYEYIKTNGEDPRTTFYLGIEYFNRGMYDFSIKVLQDFIPMSGSSEDRFLAWLKIAEAYHLIGKRESGRNAYLCAQLELPHRPDSYLGLGESYHETEDWAKSTDFILTGLSKKLPQTYQAVDKVKYTFRPAGYLALNYLSVGKPDEAYKWFMKAAQMNPKHPWVKENASLFIDGKQVDEYVRAFVKLAQLSQKKYPKTLSKIAEIIPDELQDQELLLDFKRRYTRPKVWPNNSIVYFCSSAFEDWGPDSLKTGCGGSEEAVIHLTKRWAKMGYDVTVYNNCPEEKTVDGVKWVRYERFNPRDVFNILISWRNNTFLEPHIASKKLLDMHDVPSLDFYPKNSLKDVNVLVKSNYHRTLFPHLEDSNFTIIPNGIELDKFKDTKKVKNNLVWTSSYDRGLQYLLSMWQDIKKEVPDATLDVAYGWNLFDMSARGRSEQGQQWKAIMNRLLDQEGIAHHNRLNSEQVAELYKKAEIWAYPTDFPEIDCITATKAMAAGCVPVTTDFAVMKERNQGIMVKGLGSEYDTQEKFKKELIKLLKDDGKKEQLRKGIDVSGYDWDSVAEQWDKVFRGE